MSGGEILDARKRRKVIRRNCFRDHFGSRQAGPVSDPTPLSPYCYDSFAQRCLRVRFHTAITQLVDEGLGESEDDAKIEGCRQGGSEGRGEDDRRMHTHLAKRRPEVPRCSPAIGRLGKRVGKIRTGESDIPEPL